MSLDSFSLRRRRDACESKVRVRPRTGAITPRDLDSCSRRRDHRRGEMARSDPFKPLITFLLLVGAALYFGGILYAGVRSIQKSGEPDINDFIKYVVASLGGVLGTHLGAVLGISRTRGGGGLGLPATGYATAAGLSRRQGRLQIAAAYFYVISLAAALGLWAIDGFSVNSAELIRTMGVNLVGVIVGSRS